MQQGAAALYKTIICFAIACLLSISQSFAVGWLPSSMAAFGAGDSDNGRSLQLYHIPISPPYWNGRFQNGPAWVEWLAYKFKLIPNPEQNPDYNKHAKFVDYSYYDATATDMYIDNSAYYMTFNDEINQYLTEKHPFPRNTLGVVYMGENDLSSDSCRDDPLRCMQNIYDALTNGMIKLCKKGHITHFLLITPAGGHNSPYVVNQYTPAQRKALLQFEDSFYGGIRSIISSVNARCRLASIDIFNLVAYEAKWQKSYTIPISDPCYNNMGKEDGVYNRVLDNGPVCANPNKHFYFDIFFVSDSVAQLFADATYKQVLDFKWTRPSWPSKLHKLWDKIF